MNKKDFEELIGIVSRCWTNFDKADVIDWLARCYVQCVKETKRKEENVSLCVLCNKPLKLEQKIINSAKYAGFCHKTCYDNKQKEEA